MNMINMFKLNYFTTVLIVLNGLLCTQAVSNREHEGRYQRSCLFYNAEELETRQKKNLQRIEQNNLFF